MRGILTKERMQKGLMLLAMAAVVFWVAFCGATGAVETTTESSMRAFTLILWSILLEALPFVLLGTIVSSLIQVFVTEDMILRVLPKNRILRIAAAALVGIVFPVCECAIIPITRGLIKKGLPVGPAMAFMIATPIVNPVVMLSTYNAFPTMPQMMLYRAAGGFLAALLIGLLAGRAEGKSVLRPDRSAPACPCGHDHAHENDAACSCGHNHAHENDAACSCGHDHEHREHCSCGHEHGSTVSRFGIFKEVVSHTGAELRSVGMYLIFGAVIAAAMQIAVPREVLTAVGGGRMASILVMMALAFVMSLCSEADAFVASTFLLQFSGASVLAFLLVGPMIDIKNTMMMLGSFRKRFVLRVALSILLVCFLLALAASFLIGGGSNA